MFLQQVTRCTRTNGIEHMLVVVKHREHEDGNVFVTVANTRYGFDAIHSRHVDIHDQQIGFEHVKMGFYVQGILVCTHQLNSVIQA